MRVRLDWRVWRRRVVQNFKMFVDILIVLLFMFMLSTHNYNYAFIHI